MYRRALLKTAASASSVAFLNQSSISIPSSNSPDSEGTDWKQVYDTHGIEATTAAHDTGVVAVNRAGYNASGDTKLRLFRIDREGELKEQSVLLNPSPDASTDATPDIMSVNSGYVVAQGGWLGLFDTDFELQRESEDSDINANGQSILGSIGDKIVVATEFLTTGSASTDVRAYNRELERQWSRDLAADSPQWLQFMTENPASDSVAVGGYKGGGSGWLVHVASDGSVEWEASVPELGERNHIAGIYTNRCLKVVGESTVCVSESGRELERMATLGLSNQGASKLVALPDGSVLAAGVRPESTVLLAQYGGGELLWSTEMQLSPDNLRVADIVVVNDEKVLVVGSQWGSDSTRGWAVQVSVSDLGSMPTTTERVGTTAQRSSTGERTEVTQDTGSSSRVSSDQRGEGETDGFGVLCGLAGIVGLGARRLRK